MKKILLLLLVFFYALNFTYAKQNFNKNKPLNITSDEVFIYRDKQKIEFIKNVVAKQDNFTLKTDKMIIYYNENNKNKIDIKNIEVKNNVTFSTTNLVATSDIGNYDPIKNIITLQKNVKITENKITLLANKFEYFVLTGETKIEGNKNEEDKVTIILD